jgi:putative ABC transport system permease protein
MRFVLRMAWRETRASYARLAFFFVCVALGVAAIVVLRSVVQQVRDTLTREARYLVGADIVVQSSQPWTGERLARLETELAGAAVRARTEVVETQTMATPAAGGTGAVRLVEVRAVGEGFPFYGAPELEGGLAYSTALFADRGVLVAPELLLEMGLRPGDGLLLGGQVFTIRGVVTRDRVQRAGGIAFGPRVYVGLADLRATPILGFGSRATHQVHLRVDADAIVRLTGQLRRAFRQDAASVRSWRGVEDRLGRNLSTAENYLSLVGLAIVVLGGIGVWSVTRTVVQQKIRSVAILKCVGASSRQILATYGLLVLWLSAAASLLGVGLAAAAVAAIPRRTLEPMGITEVGLSLSAVAQGVAVGLLVSMLFALVPLLEVRRVKPLLLLRADTVASARRRDWRSVLLTSAIVVVLGAVAVWQAGSLRAGLYVSGGLATVGLALYGLSLVVLKLVAPLARSRRFAVRHAVISLGRPGNQTRVILMAVGLGCFFILSVRALQTNLTEVFSLQVGENTPDFVLIDIQRDQVDGVRDAVSPHVRRPPRLLPMLRARVVGIDGRRASLPTAEDVRRQGSLTREYGITYRDALQDNETLVAGRFWPGRLETEATADGADTEVSIEQEVRDEAQVEVGDLMRFSLGGRVLSARVTSIRRVTWGETQNGGFIFVFRPSPALDRMPQTFVGFLEVADDPAARVKLQQSLVRAFPNVSAIDVRDVLAALEQVIANATLGVTVVGAVTLVSGVLILIGAVAVTRFQRLYEAAIYRTLGASTRTLGSMMAVEYGLVGLLAGALAAVGALGLTWAMARYLFEIDWRPAPVLLTAGVLITGAAVAIVGLAASAGILMQKPLATLRNE